MPIEQLIFLAIYGHVVALHRDSGEVVWTSKELGQGYTTLLLDGDRLIVTAGDRVYCLTPQTGKTLWENRIKGKGFLVVPCSIASIRGQANSTQADDQTAMRALTTAAMIAST